MSYYDELVKWKDFDFEKYFSNVTDEGIKESIKKDKLSVYDYLNLLSPTKSFGGNGSESCKTYKATFWKCNRIVSSNICF